MGVGRERTAQAESRAGLRFAACGTYLYLPKYNRYLTVVVMLYTHSLQAFSVALSLEIVPASIPALEGLSIIRPAGR